MHRTQPKHGPICSMAMSQSPAGLRLSRKLQANLAVYKAPHQHMLVRSLTTSLEITSWHYS